MKHEPIRVPDRDYLLWFAGFMDGEGSFTIGSNTQRRSYGEYPSFMRMVSVVNTNRDVIDEAQREFASGKIRDMARYPSWNPDGKWKNAYIISWHSGQSREMASLLTPFLRIKREQAEIIASWPDKFRGGNQHRGRDTETHAAQLALWERMKALNRRGA